MYLVAIAWIYVVLMMALAEAMSPQGSVLGAVFTALLYGALPLTIVVYIMGTPHRRRARRAAEAALAALAEAEAMGESAGTPAAGSAAPTPDRGGEAPADAVAPVREEA